MKLPSFLAGLAVAAGLSFSSADAATESFVGSPLGFVPSITDTIPEIGGIGYEITPEAGGFLNCCGLAVATSPFGLGVFGGPDQLGTFVIDSTFGYERLNVAFDAPVHLTEITLGLVDGFDEFNIYLDGVATADSPTNTTPYTVNQVVTSFAVEAVYRPIAELDILGFDYLTLASFEVAAVPLPASGLLLVAGLGGVVALRRKRRPA